MKKTVLAIFFVCAVYMMTAVTALADFYNIAYEYDGLAQSIRNNCVMFARYKLPSLPYGLTSYQDKINIINSYTAIAGEVAITPGNSSYGHVAYVESVSGNTITIIEGGVKNKYDGIYHINRRSGTASELEITGYYNPGGLNGDVNAHIHTFPYLGYEQLHPHKIYKECICGHTEYTGETQYLDDCSECNPPVASQMSVSTDNADSITQSNATVHGTVSYSGDRPSEVGLYFGTSPDYLYRVAYESINFNKNPFNVWYDLNNEASQYLSADTTYYYRFYAVQNGIEVGGETKSFTTSPSQQQSPTDIWVSTDGADSVTSSNATVRGSAGYSGNRPSEVGLYFGTTPDNMNKVAHESINFSKNPFDIWYDLNSEAGQYLSAGTTYYYRIYAVQNGIEVNGETKSFTTSSASPSTDVWVSTDGVDSFNGGNATVRGSAGYSGNRPTEAGLYFGTSPDNMSKVARDAINFSKNPFNLWYDLNSEAGQYLSSGTTYYYKMYAIQNGIEVCGETKSFVAP